MFLTQNEHHITEKTRISNLVARGLIVCAVQSNVICQQCNRQGGTENITRPHPLKTGVGETQFPTKYKTQGLTFIILSFWEHFGTERGYKGS